MCNRLVKLINMSKSSSLIKKISIITGAANGIGLAICRRFAAEGSKLMMVDLDRSALQKAKEELSLKNDSDDILTMHGNIAESGFAQVVVDAVFKHFGTTSSILVNNAGIGDMSLVSNMSDHQFQTVLDVNLKGTFFFTRAFLKQFNFDKESNKSKDESLKASIINIASLAGKLGMYRYANYAASKSGVIGFTKSVCTEVAEHGIRCNVVLPGFVKTAMIESASSSFMEANQQLNPMKRLGTVDEIANVCFFLASNESSYVNGACIDVTGGFGA